MSTKWHCATVALMLALALPVIAQQSGRQDFELLKARSDRARQRQEEFYRLRSYPREAISAGARAAAVAEMERMIAREKQTAKARGRAASAQSWTLIGPRPTNVQPLNTNAGPPFSAGRVSALAVDPRNPDVVYLGAAGGGVWKTTDGGINWTPLTDDQPSLAIGSIALAPSNPDIVYVGTGEQNNSGDSYYGAGVLKSTDGGASWRQLAGPFVGPFNASRTSGGGARIGALAVHPTNPDIVLAAVDRAPAVLSGIYRSTDGGATWTNVLSGAVGTDVVFNPSDPSIVYAALGSSGGSARNGVYKSTNGGVNWNLSGGTGATALPTANLGRIAIGLAPSNPNTLYVGIQNASATLFGALLGMFKSTDGAQTWTRVFSPDYCAPQCSYNNIIRVHPANPNIVVAAGLPPWRSFDGGLSWLNLASGSNGLFAHTDHHALAFTGDGARLYDGNDGGVFSTTNQSPAAGPWTNLNGTLAITEFSSNVSIHPSDPNIAYGGTQDNGTLAYTGDLAWDQVVGGDGGWTAVDPAVPSIWYGSFFGISPYKLSGVPSVANVGTSFVRNAGILANGIDTQNDRSLFYAPIRMDPSNPVRLYYATQRLYQSNDGAGNWAPISRNLTDGQISAIAVSASFPKAVYVGTTDGKVQVTNAAEPGADPLWLDRSAGLPGRSVSQIAVDPLNPAIFYVALSGFSGFLVNDRAGHVFKTTDFGETWTDISEGLPNIPVNDIVVDPDLPDTLYIATDIGVFQSANGGQTWSTLSTGLPRVLVQSLNLHRPTRTLRAVTRGRSMWDLGVPLTGASLAPRIASVAPASLNAGASPLTITMTGSNFASNSIARWNGLDRPTTFVDGATLRVTLSAGDLSKAGRGTILVFNPVAGGGLSNSVNIPVGPAPGVSASGIVNAANPAVSGPLVPGSVGSIFGTNLAPDVVVAATPPLPYTLGDVTVEINGIPAPLFFVAPGQINFQTPWDLLSFNRATLRIINGTLVSSTLDVNVAPAAPALFSTNGSGGSQGEILIAGSQVLAAPADAFPNSRPVKRGEEIEIYATGLGPVSRTPLDGSSYPLTGPPAITRTPVVTIGGVPATVLFSGLARGAVGLYQVNVTVPDDAPLGDAVPVSLSMSGVQSNTVTVAVQSK